jgi:hypothetical protein
VPTGCERTPLRGCRRCAAGGRLAIYIFVHLSLTIFVFLHRFTLEKLCPISPSPLLDHLLSRAWRCPVPDSTAAHTTDSVYLPREPR